MSAAAARAATWPRLASPTGELTMVEGRRLLRHPVFLAGVLLSIAFAVTFADRVGVGATYFVLVGPAALPVALATLIAANLAALRSDRSDTGELYGSLAAPASTRTYAHLLSLGWVTAACAVLTAVGFAAYEAWDGLPVTRDGATAVPSPAELAAGPVAVAALGALGVALARWLPHLTVAPLAAVALLVVEAPLTTWNYQRWPAWLAPAVNPAQTPEGASWPCTVDQTWPCLLDSFASGAVGWHLLYLAGLTVLFAALALLRDGGRRGPVTAAGAAGAGLALVGGILQLP